MPDFSIEDKKRQLDFSNIAGVDEAGRGPLAGPVVVSAVVLGPSWNKNHKLADSKTLKPSVREEFFQIICREAKGVSTVSIPAFEVDRLNVLQASMVGMKKAVEHLNSIADYVLVDGNRYPEINLPGSILNFGKGKLYFFASSVTTSEILLA